MAILRMDNIGLVVADLDAATEFFVDLGLEFLGRQFVEGDWVDHTVGLDDVRCEIAMLRTPDGHSQIEIAQYHRPEAVPGDATVPVNALGIRRLCFAVDDLDAALATCARHGAFPLDQVVQFEDAYRLCYVRGPEGIIVMLAEPLGEGGAPPAG
jgi:catechol 2,3-dioxygenase-like lactoylglutathione lyase family enzyme